MVSRAAAFSGCLRAQASDFLRDGFVLIRKGEHTRLEDVNSLNDQVVRYSQSIQSSLKYKLWRFFNSVDSSSNRHSIPLHVGVSPLLLPVLGSSVASISGFLQTLFTHPSAPLVELSALISYPNSKQQTVHSDIKYSSKETSHIISGFIALCDITIDNGPTHLHASTHTQSFHEWRIRESRSKSVSYSSDGSAETDEEIFNALDQRGSIPSAADDSDDIASRLPLRALLSAGDMLIFDTKLFHFGGANVSSSPRALLCFAFQGGDVGAKVEGFTYHCHESIVDMKATLASFEQR